MKETTDTVNWDYINPHLQAELEVYQGKGDWKSASRVQATMLSLTDSLRQKERKEAITKSKFANILKGVQYYLSENKVKNYRIDVIGITLKPEIKIEHLKNISLF